MPAPNERCVGRAPSQPANPSGDLREAELIRRMGKALALLRRTDSLVQRLEVLNLKEITSAPPEVEEVVLGLLNTLAIEVGDSSVQTLLDAMFEGQQPILAELQACRRIQLARSAALGAVPLMERARAEAVAARAWPRRPRLREVDSLYPERASRRPACRPEPL